MPFPVPTTGAERTTTRGTDHAVASCMKMIHEDGDDERASQASSSSLLLSELEERLASAAS